MWEKIFNNNDVYNNKLNNNDVVYYSNLNYSKDQLDLYDSIEFIGTSLIDDSNLLYKVLSVEDIPKNYTVVKILE